MRESSIVRKIIAAVKKKYPRAYVRKLSDRFTRGIPDILIVAHQCDYMVSGLAGGGRGGGPLILFVETKTKKGHASKLQEAELKSIQENGAEAIIAKDVETVLNKLEQMGAV